MRTVAVIATMMLALFAAPATAVYHVPPEPMSSGSGLAGVTLLIIRHAEQPDVGTGLTPAGKARAEAYADYFRNFQIDGKPVRIDTLVASIDSGQSKRPRLTLKPLSHAIGVSIEQPYRDQDVRPLVNWLRQGQANRTILISWHHAEVPRMLAKLGLNPTSILPDGIWPEDAYDWVVVVRYDAHGVIIPGAARLIHEQLPAAQ